MRNRAKCKVCGDVIESMHRHDFVTCKCKEIFIDGGRDYVRCGAVNRDNLVRLDDDGNEIVPKPLEESKQEEKPVIEEQKLTRKDLLEALKNDLEYNSKLPNHEMLHPVSQYQLHSLMELMYMILNTEN